MLISEIKVGENYSREELGDISQLKRSIEQYGLQQPVIIDRDGNLVAGFRRFAACQQLGWQEIAVTITTMDGGIVNLIENLERENLTFYEESLCIKKLYPGCSDVEIADAVGRTVGWSRPRNKLWTLPQEIIDKVKTGEINSHKITMLLGAKNQALLIEKLLKNEDLQVRHRPKKADLKRIITMCLERDQLAAMNAIRFVIGDISEQEFWDKLTKDSA